MTVSSAHGDLASACAADIYEGFSTYNFYFHTVTQRAAARFAARDWAGSQRDAVQRIELYEQAVRRSLTRVRHRLGDQLHDKTIWRDIKLRFEDEIRPYLDREFTKTFFSSVTRRIFKTEGVDPQIEFITIGDDAVNENTRYANYRHYEARGSYWQSFHQYTLLGRAKQGKTERYRNLFAHLQKSQDQFCDWAFDRGMVMMVFALPSYPVVFKVIRDRFAYPKTTVRRDVLDAYQLVFKHDRAGRLIDAQEFRHLKIARDRFEPALLDELLRDASDVVKVDGQDVIVEHLYIERRLIPLNQYLREASPAAARAAVIDYGDAIRDLASSNIFPGDLLLKNFGVTRHGRVIFFDYDELCLVTDCHFRDLPEARNHEEEMTSGAWFYVADNDVFPEQFPSFLGLEGDLLALFCDVHAALMDAQYWRDLKKSLLAGQIVDLLPYTPRPL